MAVFVFWLIVQFFALAALPLAWRLFRALPGRGYVFAKPLGLLLVSYVFWLGTSVGLLRNSAGGILFAWLLVGCLSVWLGRDGLRRSDDRRLAPLFVWMRGSLRLMVTAEILFAVALAFWAFVRAHDPGINSTEKPMEFAFLNGILRSDTFPPLDPWLSGFAISYYYFGYVMMAVLTRLSGAVPSVGYIAASVVWFALTATTAFGVAYDLVGAREGQQGSDERRVPAGQVLYGLLGALFVTVLGNLEGLLEVLHSKGIGGEAFYRWLDVKNLVTAPRSSTWYPGDNWWWWRASRVIHDKTLSGASQEVIDEFPFFSFLLGDMHPHVLALPFVLLAIGLALNMVLAARTRGSDDASKSAPARSLPGRWLSYAREIWDSYVQAVPMGRVGLLLFGLCLGALGFLNTWDILPYLFLTMLAYGVVRARERGSVDGRVIGEAVGLGGLLGVLGGVLYLPFYLSFSSQAGQDGWVWPNLYNPTRLVQFFLMFGHFLVAVGFLLWVATRREGSRRVLRASAGWLPWTALLPAVLLALIVVLAQVLPQGRAFVEGLLSIPAVQADVGNKGMGEILSQVARRRLTAPGTYLLLAAFLAWTMGLLSRLTRHSGDAEDKTTSAEVSPQLTFVLLLVVTAALLTFGVELAFLKDTFSTRMNTVFKFYYQAWLLFALASVYAVSTLVRSSGAARAVGLVLVGVLVLVGMVYPVAATYSKSNRFTGVRTLDGMAYLAQWEPDQAAAIDWLWAAEPSGAAIVLEAPGGSFRPDQSRVSSATGLPTLVGWTGHELQWRGSYEEPARREPVIEQIYRSAAPAEIPTLLDEWGIKYVFVGPAEHAKYNLTPQTLSRFDRVMDKVFEQGMVRIYRRR
jgi:YYY domain-containing protein